MPHGLFHPRAALLLALGLGAGACSSSDGPLDPAAPEAPTLLSVVPRGGATGVDRSAPVVVTFDHALMAGMEAYAALHQGDVEGPEVHGTWTMSSDRRTVTFMPDGPLAPDTDHTIHLGGGMTDAAGHHADLGTHGPHMGGEWATSGMAGEGHMGRHGGTGWRHPTNGSYGMVFTFTTGR